MTNPFATNALVPTWFSVGVLKGDLPGHPFRGNQWTAGSLVDKSKSLVSGGPVSQLANLPRLSPELIEGHLDVANTHNELGAKAFAEGKPELGNAHLEASAAHLNVARLFSRAGQPEAPAGLHNQAQGNAWFAHRMTEKAAEAAGEKVEKSSEQSSHHRKKAQYHRKVAQALTAKGFIYPASLHIHAANAHDEAAEANKGEDNSNAIESANDASSAAESALAGVQTGFTSPASGDVGVSL